MPETPPSALMNRPPRAFVPELDGLRALAVLAVMACHTHLMAPGWLGVNLFFVISGFLITGILLDTRENPHFFRNFYTRRFLRIFPVYYLVLFGAAVTLAALGRHQGALPYYFCYLQNFVISNASLHPNAPEPLSHTWSLAVEEQFYLVWPLIVFLVRDRKMLRGLCVFLFMLALGLRALLCLYYRNSMLAYMYPFTNMDALGAGAFLAVALRIDREKFFARAEGAMTAARIMLILSVAGLFVYHFVPPNLKGVGLIGGIEPLNADRLFLAPGGWLWPSIFAVLFALLVMSAHCRIPRASWLACKPLRFIGKISYGIYMYHYLLCGITRAWWFVLPASLAAATVSWYLIEKPCLDLKDKLAPD